MNYDGKVNTKRQVLQHNLEESREKGMKNKLSFEIYGIKTCCLSPASGRAKKGLRVCMLRRTFLSYLGTCKFCAEESWNE